MDRETDTRLIARYGADGARLRRKLAELVPLAIWRRPPFDQIDYEPYAAYYEPFIADLSEAERKRFFDALVAEMIFRATDIIPSRGDADRELYNLIMARDRDARHADWQKYRDDPLRHARWIRDPLKKKDVRAIFDEAARNIVPSYVVDNALKRQLDPFAAVYSKRIRDGCKVFVFVHFGSIGCESAELSIGTEEPDSIIRAVSLLGPGKHVWRYQTPTECRTAGEDLMRTAAGLLPIIEGKVVEYRADSRRSE